MSHILYLGTHDGTCLDRAQAYRRLGHVVRHVNPRRLLPPTPWVDRLTWRLGGHLFGPLLASALRRALGRQRFDVCHVDLGEWVTPAVIGVLRLHAPIVINYNIDDPLGPRDGPRFRAYRQSIPHYDLLAVVRHENVDEARAAGARQVMRLYRSADEVTHAERPLSDADRDRWACDVLFLGTWMPERGPFLQDLVRRGVPLTIQGGGWHKAPEWPSLRPYWRGGSVHGNDYAKAIQCARVNLGLLSKGNRDLHTTRSLEIPALGALFCAERTPEHQTMYCEGEEAVFWSDAQECAWACAGLLAEDARRRRIAQNGHRRLCANGHLNERAMASMLEAVGLPAMQPNTAALLPQLALG